MPISHLCFADDLIVFTRVARRSVQVLMDFLARYEDVSGQKINRGKSNFFVSKHCPLPQIRLLSHLTGILHTTLPFKYLRCFPF